MKKSPAYIRALLDAHTLPLPGISEYMAEELERGMIERAGVEQQWTTTSKGQAWVEMLCETPLPVQVWKRGE